MTTALVSLTNKLASKLDMGTDGSNLIETLKATAFKGQVSDAQMTALLVVANQFGLNPWTREVYAFPDKNNGIVPVVGVDGWARIINSHPQFDGMDFEFDAADSCTCIMHRKDRSHPIKVTEYMDECRRGTQPWQSHPRRMLRHKTMIQCARLAFGFGGIFDQDEAERIVEKDMGAAEVIDRTPQAPPPYADEQFSKNLPTWTKSMTEGKVTADQVIARVSSKATLTDAQIKQIRDAAKPAPTEPEVLDAETGDFVTAYEGAQA